MQQNTPDRERPDTGTPDVSQVTPVNTAYTSEESRELVEMPIRICRAMMAVSPSGAVGSLQEIKAMRDSFKEVLQTTSSPTLQAVHQQLQNKDRLDTLWNSAGNAFRDRWDAANVRQMAIASCQQCAKLLKKIPAAEAQAYKEFVYTVSRKVAEAAREGGVMGFGGQAISEPEQSLLNDISRTLELPRA